MAKFDQYAQTPNDVADKFNQLVEQLNKEFSIYKGAYVWIRNSGYTSPPSAWTKMTGFTRIKSDMWSCWNVADQKFTAPVSGTYLFTWGGFITSAGTGSERYAWEPRVNGVAANSQFAGGNLSAGDTPAPVNAVLYQLNAGDYVEMWMFSVISVDVGSNDTDHCAFFQAILL